MNKNPRTQAAEPADNPHDLSRIFAAFAIVTGIILSAGIATINTVLDADDQNKAEQAKAFTPLDKTVAYQLCSKKFPEKPKALECYETILSKGYSVDRQPLRFAFALMTLLPLGFAIASACQSRKPSTPENTP